MENENIYMNFDPRDLNVFNAPEQQSSNDLIYKTLPELSKSEDGIYRSTIRIVANVFDMANSVIEKQTYNLKDANGFFRVDSPLSVNDRDCPLFKAWKQLRYSTAENAADIQKFAKRVFDKSTARYCIVQIVEDDNQPELVNKFRIFKLPVFIWRNISEKMNPSDMKKSPVPIMDFILGKLIELNVTPGPDDPAHPERKKREISYETSTITDDTHMVCREDGTSFFDDNEQGIVETYIDMVTKAMKERKPEVRNAKLAEIKQDPIYGQIGQLYMKLAGELKNVMPDLQKEIGFNYFNKEAGKIWDDETTRRVDNFIKIALTLNDPASVSPGAPDVNVLGTNSGEPEQAKEVPATSTDATSAAPADPFLPF